MRAVPLLRRVPTYDGINTRDALHDERRRAISRRCREMSDDERVQRDDARIIMSDEMPPRCHDDRCAMTQNMMMFMRRDERDIYWWWALRAQRRYALLFTTIIFYYFVNMAPSSMFINITLRHHIAYHTERCRRVYATTPRAYASLILRHYFPRRQRCRHDAEPTPLYVTPHRATSFRCRAQHVYLRDIIILTYAIRELLKIFAFRYFIRHYDARASTEMQRVELRADYAEIRRKRAWKYALLEMRWQRRDAERYFIIRDATPLCAIIETRRCRRATMTMPTKYDDITTLRRAQRDVRDNMPYHIIYADDRRDERHARCAWLRAMRRCRWRAIIYAMRCRAITMSDRAIRCCRRELRDASDERCAMSWWWCRRAMRWAMMMFTMMPPPMMRC